MTRRHPIPAAGIFPPQYNLIAGEMSAAAIRRCRLGSRRADDLAAVARVGARRRRGAHGLQGRELPDVLDQARDLGVEVALLLHPIRYLAHRVAQAIIRPEGGGETD